MYVWYTTCFHTCAHVYTVCLWVYVCMVLCVHVYVYCVCMFLPTQHVGRWATLPKCEHACVPPQGLACCFGICAIAHLEDTLAQLEDFVRSDVFRKSVGIFSIFKVRRVTTQNGGLGE